MKPRTTITTALAVTVLALSACGSSPWVGTQLDEFGWYACQDYTEQMSKAGGAEMAYELTPAQRVAFVAGIRKSAARSTTPEIKDAADMLDNGVSGTQTEWQSGMAAFALKCLEKDFKVT